MKRIGVLFTAYIRSEIGGGYFVLARLSNYFKRHSSKVVPVVLMNNSQGFLNKYLDRSIPRYPLQIPRSIFNVQRRTLSAAKLFRASFSMVSYLPVLIRQISQICNSHDVTLIHVHSHTSFLLMCPLAKMKRIKLVVHFHDSMLNLDRGGSLDQTTAKILLFALRHFADAIIAISEFVRDTIIQKDPGLSHKIHVVHNGLDVCHIGQNISTTYNGGTPLLLSYGVLADRKGFQTVIESVAILRHRFGIDVHYRIIGDGPYRDELLRLAKFRQVSDLVEIIGFKKNIHKYVAQADIVIIPSRYEEPFGLVVTESMANSKIIIATWSGAIPEILRDGQDGYLVKKSDPDEIADRVIRIMNNPVVANRMAESAYARVQRYFSIDHMGAEVERIYGLLVGAG